MIQKLTHTLVTVGAVCFIVALLMPSGWEPGRLVAALLGAGIIFGFIAALVTAAAFVEGLLTGVVEPEPEEEPKKLADVQTELRQSPSYQQLLDIQAQLSRMNDSEAVIQTRQVAASAIEDVLLVELRDRLDPLAEEAKALRQAQDEIRSGDVVTSDIERQLSQDRTRRRRHGGIVETITRRVRR